MSLALVSIIVGIAGCQKWVTVEGSPVDRTATGISFGLGVTAVLIVGGFIAWASAY